MKNLFLRLKPLIKKELLTLFRDPKSRIVLIAPPMMQLFVFAFAATLEVKNISLVILNQDTGKHSSELIQRMTGAPSFTEIKIAKNLEEFKDAIDEQTAIAGLQIQQDFSRTIESGDSANLQVIMDGRRSNASQIVNAYLADLVNTYGDEIAADHTNNPKKIKIVERNWFNQNLLYMWYTIPSLVIILAMIIALIITSLSVSRERELGTFDQILVSPLLPHEILIGKTIPAVIVALLEGLLIWSVGVLVFQVPFNGSFLLLVTYMTFFVMSVVGVGLFISSIAKTQQQSILGTFIFMVPVVTLSGYASPVENMPVWLQHATWFNPLMHALIVIKGLFLKQLTFSEVWPNLWPLWVITAFALTYANHSFSKRLS